MNHIRPVVLKMALAASMLLGASFVVSPAKAGDVTFHFTGIVDHSGLSNFSQNDQLTGSFRFESTTQNSTPASSQFGSYNDSISNLTFTIGSYSSTTNGSPILNSSIMVGNSNFQADQFIVSTPISTGQNLNPLTFEMNLFLGEPLGNSFSDTSLPIHPPSILPDHPIGTPGNQFTPFRIVFGNGGNGNLVVDGRITLVSTPLPPAVILFGAGLVALIGLGARNWRLRETA